LEFLAEPLAYSGDLAEKLFPKKLTNGVIGITANYELQAQIFIRAGFNYSVVGVMTNTAKTRPCKHRNLVLKLRCGIQFDREYYIFDLYNQKFPLISLPVLPIYHFNPYAYDKNGHRSISTF